MLRAFAFMWLGYWVAALALPVSRSSGMLGTFALQAMFVVLMASAIALGMKELSKASPRKRPMRLSSHSHRIEPPSKSRKTFLLKINVLSMVIALAPVLLIIDKIVLDGLDYSQGLTRIRAVQAASENSASVFSVLGYIMLSQVTVLTYLVLTHSDLVSKWRRIFSVGMCLLTTLIFSILIGGRSPLFVFLTATFTVFAINYSIRVKHAFWIFLIGLVTLLFSGYIFLDRIDASGTAPGIYTSIFMHWLRLEPNASVGAMGQFPAILTLIASYFAHSFYVAHEIIASNWHFNEGQSVFIFPTLLMSRIGIAEEPVTWAYAGIFSSITGQLYYQFGMTGYLACVVIYCLIIYFCFYLLRRTKRGSTLNYLSYMLISSVILTPMVLPIDFVLFPFVFVFGGIALFLMRLRA